MRRKTTTKEQRLAAEEFKAGRGYDLIGPFAVMVRSPEVMLRAKAMGDYLRFRNVLPKRVSEMVILMTAREWTQEFEWSHHYTYALEAGLTPAIIAAIADGRRPQAMAEDEAAAYDFAGELQRRKSVSDETFGKARKGSLASRVSSISSASSATSLLAMMMNVARTAPDTGTGSAIAALFRIEHGHGYKEPYLWSGSASQGGGRPRPARPVEAWNPPYCGDIGLAIGADGVWHYRRSPSGRMALVKLFASVLRKGCRRPTLSGDASGGRLDVVVKDAPFLAVEMEVRGEGRGQELIFRTNVDDIVTASPVHPLRFELGNGQRRARTLPRRARTPRGA